MKSIRCLIFFLLVSLLSTGLYAQTAYKVMAEKVNVRSNPSSQASVLGTLNKGEVIMVTQVVNGWVSFLFKEKVGYVSLFTVKKTDTPVAPSQKALPTDSPAKKEDAPAVASVPTKVQDTQKVSRDKGKEVTKRKPSKSGREQHNSVDRRGDVCLFADIFGGYSTFIADVSPKPGIGFGADAGIQTDYTRLIAKMPRNLFGEFALGYAYKGCAAYPIHCINFRILPVCYKYPLSDVKVLGKAGIYLAQPFSDIDTGYQTFYMSFDVGLSVGVGAEYRDIGAMISYEHGLTNMLDSRGLCNRGVYLTVSYKFKKF